MSGRFQRGVTRFLATAAIVTTTVVAVPGGTAIAGTGFNQWSWASVGVTLSSTSYRYSNMSGFWQAVLNSNGCNTAVDGNYGSVTHWWTDTFQWEIVGSHNAGTMTPSYLGAVQNATSVYGPRLSWTFFTDGYGTRHYSYYAGEDLPVNLGWNPISSQWLFSQFPASAPYALVPATPNRTITSVAACA